MISLILPMAASCSASFTSLLPSCRPMPLPGCLVAGCCPLWPGLPDWALCAFSLSSPGCASLASACCPSPGCCPCLPDWLFCWPPFCAPACCCAPLAPACCRMRFIKLDTASRNLPSSPEFSLGLPAACLSSPCPCLPGLPADGPFRPAPSDHRRRLRRNRPHRLSECSRGRRTYALASHGRHSRKAHDSLSQGSGGVP